MYKQKTQKENIIFFNIFQSQRLFIALQGLF